jgi:hypothetical protein
VETIVVTLIGFLTAGVTGLAGYVAYQAKENNSYRTKQSEKDERDKLEQNKNMDYLLKEQRKICQEERDRDSTHYQRVISLMEKDIAMREERENKNQELLASLTKSIGTVSAYIFENTKTKRVPAEVK